MLARTVRTALILVLPVACVAVATWLSGSRAAWPEDAKESKLAGLLKERLVATKDLYRAAMEKLNVGTALVEEVNNARLALLRAELDGCATDAERAAATGRSLAEARKIEETVARQIAEGLLAPIEALRTRVFRLETEIDLERLRTRAGL